MALGSPFTFPSSVSLMVKWGEIYFPAGESTGMETVGGRGVEERSIPEGSQSGLGTDRTEFAGPGDIHWGGTEMPVS